MVGLKWLFKSLKEKKKVVVLLVVATTVVTCFLVARFGRDNFVEMAHKSPPGPDNVRGSFGCRPLPETLKKQILLVSYGRSGSSFISALIAQMFGVFFVFEPLYVLRSRGPDSMETSSVEIVKAFLSCTVPDDLIYVVDNIQHLNSDSTKDFGACMSSELQGLPHLECFIKLLDTCRKQNTTFVKTIRFRIKWAEVLLKNNSDLQLLYLVRDPRATLFSQARLFGDFDFKRDVQNISRRHCGFVDEDLRDAERLSKLYPRRVQAIRYEDVAIDPITFTKKMYRFLNTTYRKEIEVFIQNITAYTVDNELADSAYTVFRRNSTKTMDKWRYDAGFNSVREVDQICGYLYPQLGYKKVLSQSHLESHQSLLETADGLFGL